MLGSIENKIEKERRRAVKRAEQQDGYREGTFRHTFDGSLCRTEVTFYPKRKWWVETIDEHGNASNRRPLTANIWTRLEPAIKLED